MRNKVVPAVLLPLVLVSLVLTGCARKATAGSAVGVINGLGPADRPHAVRVTGALDWNALEKIGEAVRRAGERGAFVSLDLSGTTGLWEIGREAFEDCITLAGVKIPKGVTVIGESAFSGCTALANVEIPEGVRGIRGNAFRGCIDLARVKIPKGVMAIEDGAFSGCTGLASVEIPEGVTAIGNNAFLGCTALARVEIPASVTKIGDSAFSGCPGLADIGFPDGWEGGELWFAVIGQTLNESVANVADFDFVGEWDTQFVELYESYSYKDEEIEKTFMAVTSGNATVTETKYEHRRAYYREYDYESYKQSAGSDEHFTVSFDDENRTFTRTPTSLDEPWTGTYEEFVEDLEEMGEYARVTTNSSKTAVKFEASDGEDKTTVIMVKR